MIVLLSPAKRLSPENPQPASRYTLPENLERSRELVERLRKFSPAKLAELMDISPELAKLNHQRFQDWTADFSPEQAQPAILSFLGDVYQGLDAASLKPADLAWAQEHLRILSGLHGVLRPLDLMKPYRLEMGTGLAIKKAKNLYAYWGEGPTRQINAALQALPGEKPVVLNLASAEYVKVIKPAALEATLINVDFLEFKNGTFKPIQLFLKQARGYMARWIIQKRITRPEHLAGFAEQGYGYNEAASGPQRLVFQRIGSGGVPGAGVRVGLKA